MYELIIHPRVGNDRVESFASPYDMSRAHGAYIACDIKVTPTIDGVECYAYLNASGVRSYTKKAN